MRPTQSLAFLLLLVLSASAAAKVAAKSLPMMPANVSDEIRQPAASIDPRLEALKTVQIQRPAPAQVTSREEARQLRQAEAGVWLNQAGKLRAYREDGTVTTGDAKEARQLEYIALLNAERAGNESRKDVRAALLQEIRTDQTLPGEQRCEAVARDKYFELWKWQMKRIEASGFRQGKRDAPPVLENGSVENPAAERLAAYANIERSLIREFPGAPNGYEGLLNIARDSPQQQGRAIVEELLALETIPENIKNQAMIMRARYALVGRSLARLAPDLPLASGIETWLYSYSANHPASIDMARTLVAGKPDAVELTGLCLDRETPLAAHSEKTGAGQPPGRIIQDDGNLSAALVMTAPGLVYAVGSDGKIRTINLLNELRATRMFANKGRVRK